MPKAPIDTIRSLYSALAAGDAGSALGRMSADIEWFAMWPYKARGPGPQNVAEGVFVPLQKDCEAFEIVPSEYLRDRPMFDLAIDGKLRGCGIGKRRNWSLRI